MGSPLGAATERLTEDGDACEARYLSDVSKRDRRWDQRRVSAGIVEEIFRGWDHPTFSRWSPRLEMCSQVLEFGWSPDRQFEGVLSLKLKRAWFCKVPFCTVCMWRKSLTKLARLYSALPQIREDYPRHRWLFLTFTVKNVGVDSVRSELKHIHESFARLTKRVEWSRSFVGWLRTTEITKGQDGPMMAHPHIHCLAMVKSSYFSRHYVDLDGWIQLWRSCAQLDYDPSIEIDAIPKERDRNGNRIYYPPEMTMEDKIRKGIAETAKYALKPADISLDNADYLRILATEIRKIRMMAIGGVFREYMKDTRPTQKDLILGDGDGDGGDKNPGGVFYSWNPEWKRYIHDRG